MKKLTAVLAALILSATAGGTARAETAVGLVFGYPGNVGLSLRFLDRTVIHAAWSERYIHGTLDRWVLQSPLADDVGLSLYLGPGLDVGIPLEDDEFFLAVRVPIGLQWMVTEKVETFGEVAPGLQVVDDVDFYWAANLGIRIVL